MNQILVTEKLYITPELKRKKKFYRMNFIISIFVIIILASIYAYAEYDKSRKENISQDILSEMAIETQPDENNSEENKDVWKVIVGSIEELKKEEEKKDKEEKNGTYTASNGQIYKTVGTINIPSINVKYPILSETTEALLKVSPCKFYGPEPNEVGNFCVAGHNYRNSQFFSKALDLVVGDVINITDLSGRTIKYSIYDKYTVVPEDTSCTSQLTNGKKIVTLITCTDDNAKRVIIQAKEIE